MVHDNDVLVSTAVMDWEATCVVSIQFTDGHDLEKELVESDLGHWLLRQTWWWGLRLS